jgi:arylsulfatase A-like enzyme
MHLWLRAFTSAVLVMAGIPVSPGASPRPNIVLFLVDDMGWMDCGVYGSKYYETPNMDRFAQRAMRFTRAYANPLCSPSRASILTGKHPTRHGILTASGHQPPQPPGFNFLPETAAPHRAMISPISKNYLDPAEYTLAEALRDAGYRTAHIGKWHLGLTRPHWPEAQGFDVAWHCHPDPGPPGGYFSPYGVLAQGEPRGQIKVGTITDGPPGEYIVDRQAAEAVKFLNENKDRPFFLNLWCYGVHGPWGHKEEYTREFAQKQDPRGAQGNPIMASMLRSVDECFGRILDELDRLQLTDNTIVLFYSDNGGNVHSNVPDTAKTAKAEKAKSGFLADWRQWAGNRPPTSNAPLRDGKGTLYEGGTRVPMMWSWPGRIAPGTVSEALAGHIDIYPTLLELAGLPRPAQQVMDGVSLAPVLLGKAAHARTNFFNYFPYRPNEGGVTVVSGDYKLIRWFGPGVPRELYNLREDIGETKNLADVLPAKVKELDALMDGFLRETGALVPKPNPAFRPATANPPTRPLGGWQPKSARAEVRAGTLIVTADGRNPFLGVSGLNHPGPVTLSLRARGAGGPARVQWRTRDQDTFPASGQSVAFELPGGDRWQETAVTLPVTGSLLHLRLYLPAQNRPVELDWVVLNSKAPKPQRWDFGP